MFMDVVTNTGISEFIPQFIFPKVCKLLNFFLGVVTGSSFCNSPFALRTARVSQCK